MRMPMCAGALAGLLAVSGLGVLTAPAAQAAVAVFPVPTSDAGLGRIVTAPDGNMWFIEREAKKFGRITPSGQIDEWPLYAENEYAEAQSIDVGPDGTVWVVYNGGDYAASVTFDGFGDPHFIVYNFNDNPYGGQIRVDPTGTAWVTMNYNESGIAVLTPTEWTWPSNAPACDDVLGVGSDGSMWCGREGSIIHLNPGAAGGATYPNHAPVYPNQMNAAEWTQSLAAGPTGSIWFTSGLTEGMFNYAALGGIGYLDAATGNVTAWHTGSSTMPTSLRQGPDGNMWFTVDGSPDVRSIGHISPTGVGAVTRIDGYEPESLTFGPDGAVWFTDATNNSIVRVTTDELQTTNVDLGSGVTMTLGTPAGPGGPELPGGPGGQGANPLVTGKVAKKQVPLRNGSLLLRVACPKTAAARCDGTAVVRAKKQLTRAKAFRIKPGKAKRLRLELTKQGAKQLAGKRRLAATAVLTGGGYTTAKKVKVVR